MINLESEEERGGGWWAVTNGNPAINMFIIKVALIDELLQGRRSIFSIFYIYLFCFTSHHLHAFRLAITIDSHLCKTQSLLFLIVLCTYLT
jgi:hypothetical protein